MILFENAFTETRLMQANTALALNQYRASTGHYPESLDALVPDFLTEAPLDPYTGKGFVYLVHNGEYSLYSAGATGLSRDGDDIEWDVLVAPYERPL